MEGYILQWMDKTEVKVKVESIPGSAALEADALTTKPKGWWVQGRKSSQTTGKEFNGAAVSSVVR